MRQGFGTTVGGDVVNCSVLALGVTAVRNRAVRFGGGFLQGVATNIVATGGGSIRNVTMTARNVLVSGNTIGECDKQCLLLHLAISEDSTLPSMSGCSLADRGVRRWVLPSDVHVWARERERLLRCGT